jgi:hypothetical protein
MSAGGRLGCEVRHRTCVEDEDAEPPVMRLERVEDDMGIFVCPACHEKVSVLVVFEKGEG